MGRAALLFALILSGCSGLKTYPNALDKNATIHVRTDGGTLLSRIGIALDLYTVDPGCGTQYLGTLELDDSTIELGLPLDQQVRLAYVFSRDALVGTSGTTVICKALSQSRPIGCAMPAACAASEGSNQASTTPAVAPATSPSRIRDVGEIRWGFFWSKRASHCLLLLVIPAKAGIQLFCSGNEGLDSGFRRNDE